MSYTHIHLPEIDLLKREFTENPSAVELYSKYESYIGSQESVRYLKEQIKKLQNEPILNTGHTHEGLAS